MRLKAMTWRDRVRDRKTLAWWLVGSVMVGLLLTLLASRGRLNAFNGVPGFVGMALTLGLSLGVLAWAAVAWLLDVNDWRERRKLTWSALIGLGFLLWIVWLVLTGPGDWARVRTVLLVISYYAALVGAGLLVLYLAVRVVRVAWRTPASHVSLGAERDVIGHASAEAFQLILSPQEVWTLAAALATAAAPEGTENLKGLRARVSILRDVQQQWRTDAGRAVIARLGTKLLTLVEQVERLSTDI